VVRQDHLRAIGYEKLPIDINPQAPQFPHFLQKSDRIQHNPIPNHAFAAWPQNAAGNELQNEPLFAMDDRMPGIVSTGIAGHCAEPLTQHINNLSFTLIAPLGAQNHCRLRSHQPA
jgi:hypothetical protein